MFQICLALCLSTRRPQVSCRLPTPTFSIAREQQRCAMDSGCYSLQNTFPTIEVCLREHVGISSPSRVSLRSINQVKTAMHYRQSHTGSKAFAFLACFIVALLGSIFYRRIIRSKFYLLFARRIGLRSSPSSSNFDHRYQLLSAVVVDDPLSSSDTYSNGKPSPMLSSFYKGRPRNM